MDIFKVIRGLKRRRWTVVVVTLLVVIVSGVPTPPQGHQSVSYKSAAKLLLTPASVNAQGQGLVGLEMGRSWYSRPAILQELLTSQELLTRVAQGAGEESLTWDSLRGMIEMEPISEGSEGVELFRLSVTASDPKDAEKLTRLLAQEFSSYVQELSAREFASTRRFIEELVVEAEDRALQAEEALATLREKYFGRGDDQELESQQAALESQRMQISLSIPGLQSEVSALRMYLDGLTGSPPRAALDLAADGSLSTLQGELTDARLKLAQARQVYTEASQQVVMAKERVAICQKLYKEGLDEYVRSLHEARAQELKEAVARESALSEQLSQLLAGKMTPEHRRQMQKLERELTLWEENHLALLTQLYQSRVVEQSSKRQGAVNVLEQPGPGSPIVSGTSGPLGPSRTKRMLTALPLGLILGIGAALFREHLSDSLKLRPRIEEVLKLPVVAVIPTIDSELITEWDHFKRPLVPTSTRGLSELEPSVPVAVAPTGENRELDGRTEHQTRVAHSGTNGKAGSDGGKAVAGGRPIPTESNAVPAASPFSSAFPRLPVAPATERRP